MKKWLGWEALALLVVAGSGLYLLAPGLMAAALPFVLLAACPISMLLMMRIMHGNQGGEQSTPQASADLTREEQLARLKAQQAALAERIGSLEQNEPRSMVDDEKR